MSDFFAMLLLTVVATVGAWIFSDQSVIPTDIRWASKSCEANGGIKILAADIGDLEVRCVNGAVFTVEKRSLKGEQP
jgi:hypothetical protein